MKDLLLGGRVLLCMSLLCSAALVSAQPQQRLVDTPTKGLSVTSATLEYKPYTTGRVLTVALQSNSDKTVVAYTLRVRELDGQQNIVFDGGVGFDYLAPEGSPNYILAGQPATVMAENVTDERVVSAEVTVIAIVYTDRTYEGVGGVIFDGRLNTLRQIRKSLAEERLSPAGKASLERRAAFFQSAATPQEVQ